MRLTEQQVETFHTDGMVIVKDFFNTDEVKAMQLELDRFQRDGLIRNVATDGDGKTHSSTVANLQVIPLDIKSDLFRAIHFKDDVIDAISRLIGTPYVRYLDQIFLKPGGHGAGTNWHQDNAYFKTTDPASGVGMWVAMHDASLANGTMELIPKSHLEQYAHERDLGSDHHIRCTVDESKSVPVEVAAGGVAFFNYGIAHCTRANTTDKPRAGLACHYLRTDSIPNREANTGTHITGPEATDGEAEYGVKVAGTWDAEVQRVISSA